MKAAGEGKVGLGERLRWPETVSWRWYLNDHCDKTIVAWQPWQGQIAINVRVLV